MKIKLIFSALLATVSVFGFIGCKQVKPADNNTVNDNGGEVLSNVEIDYMNFEQACAEATAFVVATFVQRGSATIDGTFMSEYEMSVKECIKGDVSDTVKVYNSAEPDGKTIDMYFEKGKEYLLPLYYSDHFGVCFFEGHIMIDLDNPSKSMIHGAPINNYSPNFDFEKADRQSVIKYVTSLIK